MIPDSTQYDAHLLNAGVERSRLIILGKEASEVEVAAISWWTY
jgi:hypothetical protein